MVRLAPRIQMPCAVGAISTGAPARTATASPGPMPDVARPPAMRRARSCRSRHVCRTGESGSPVTMPLGLVIALAYIVSVKLLTTIPLAPARPRGVLDSGREWAHREGEHSRVHG